ncbi:glycosyltransferase family 2 protein [Uliginosibacterium gangwonense]|uniref:glycosyltransferase family 2 protein n=1 Tax=Uliginosibacterium gangwonense TaxID=392736 RepID=UPI0003A1ACE8|nr:glycosyltransferase family 2 protein [Uliginosibacterium gangwonense]
MATPFFTVFTPTFNRAHTLLRPYESLCAQSCRDFEWLIVDDGSTDGTAQLVAGWIAEGKLPIRYIQQPNGGKHTAFNHGVREARGELFVPLDSDDWCSPDALERFAFHWQKIPVAEREGFSGVSCLCHDEHGKVVGSAFPASPLDIKLFDLLRCGGMVGEKWGCARTEVLREYPFPEFPDEKFVPEALVWNRIACHYKIRFINEALRVYADSGDGLVASILRIRMQSPRSAKLYYVEAARLPLGMKHRLAAWLNYGRFAVHAGLGPLAILQEGAHPFALPAWGAGLLLAWRDRLKLKRKA